MLSHCGLDLHFSNDQWYRTFSHVSWPHKYLLLRNVCSYHLLSFFNVLFLSTFVFCKFVWVPCRFWILGLCQMDRLQKFFSHSVGFLLTLMIIYFAVQILFSLIRSHLSILAFVSIAFGVLVMKQLHYFFECKIEWLSSQPNLVLHGDTVSWNDSIFLKFKTS